MSLDAAVGTERGRTTLRFLALPSEAGVDGRSMQAGRVLEWIDRAGFACAAAWSRSYCVTAYVGDVHFARPIRVGDLVEAEARIISTGRTSMQVLVTVATADPTVGEYVRATHCLLVFVAVDDERRPRPVPPWLPASLAELDLTDRGRQRVEARARIRSAMEAEAYTEAGTAPRLLLRFLAQPSDVNWGGTAHGGTVMRWIDEAAQACATGWTRRATVGVYAGGIHFHRPIAIGSVVEVESRILHTGPHSIHLATHVRSRAVTGGEAARTTQCMSISVCSGSDGSAAAVPRSRSSATRTCGSTGTPASSPRCARSSRRSGTRATDGEGSSAPPTLRSAGPGTSTAMEPTMTLLDPDSTDGRLFLGGAWQQGGGGAQPIVCPSDGSELGRYGVANADDVDRAVAAAAAAQRTWADAHFEERARVLREAGRLLEANMPEYVDWLVKEAGSAQAKAGFEAGGVAAELHFAAALALAPTGSVLRTGKPRLSLAQRVPVGVVGVISPFNFPGILSMRSVAPALALGNAVVLKPDPRTAMTGGLFLAALLAEAGLPDGLLSVLPGGADVGQALVEHPAVRVISFTGSTAAGRRVGEQAGRLLKRAHLELGGNSALVVLDDVDLDAAVSAGAWGSFLHQGQICMATGRHLVAAPLYDRYVEGLAAAADRLPVGDPRMSDVALGPIIDEHQRDHVHELVTASVDAGARLAAGGTYDGLFYRPTVLAEVRPDHRAFAEEVFGPVAPVLRFEGEEELVEIVNRSEYGLSLGILTRDVMRGLRLAERLPSGIVHINDQTVDDESVAPFGGVAASGTGVRFGGFEANADAFTETRWITAQGEIERYPF